MAALVVNRIKLGTVGKVRCMGHAVKAGWIEEVQPSRGTHAELKLAPMPSPEIKDIRGLQMVFLGPPGVGKGTYASSLEKLMKVPHIVMGDLIQNEVSQKTAMAEHLKKMTSSGQLLSDEVVFDLLTKRLKTGVPRGEAGFILDGFPRTLNQAEILSEVANIDVAVNLRLRDDVLVAKCLGRRMCSQCGGNFNFVDINSDGIRMPAVLPPPSCVSKMTTRADDIEEVVRKRMHVYHKEGRPVEEFYRSQGILLDFDIHNGIPETWSRLLLALRLHDKFRFVAQGSQKMTHDFIKSTQCMAKDYT